MAFPPPIELVKNIYPYQILIYNNIIFEYNDMVILFTADCDQYDKKWYNKGYIYIKNGWTAYFSIIGYNIIEDGQHDTFICYK